MESNTLKHHGVLGMKWGVRRYQNRDGSLTNAGKKRYNREADDGGYNRTSAGGTRFKTTSKGKNEALYANPNQWVRDDLSRTRKLTDETKNLTRELKTANDRAISKQPKTKMDLRSMSDKEMRDAINRAMLEKQYNDIFAPQNTSKGREYVSNVLDAAGSVLAITGSALGIALAIKELRG